MSGEIERSAWLADADAAYLCYRRLPEPTDGMSWIDGAKFDSDYIHGAMAEMQKTIDDRMNEIAHEAYIGYHCSPEYPPVILPPLPHSMLDCLKQLGRLFLLAIW